MGTNSQDVGAILFGRTRQRVLGLLFGHPDEQFYVRQIMRMTGGANGAIQRELEALTHAGVIGRRTSGRQVYFQADRESPIFPELQGLVLKTTGLVDVVREALLPLQGRIDLAFVFGSAATGTLARASDVDLLVVTELPFEEIVHALGSAQQRLQRELNPTVYPRAELRAKLRDNHHFLTSVLRGPRLYVIGGDDELEGLGKQRLADAPPAKPERGPRSPRGRRARPAR